MDKDKVLPPVILAAIIFLFLQIVFDISFVFVFAIAVIVLIIVVIMKTGNMAILSRASFMSSLTSKLPTTKSSLGPIAWTIVILAVVVGLIAVFCTTGDEDFKFERFKKGYDYTGDYAIKNEALEFNETLLISNRVDREYKYYNLYILQGEGTVDITVGNYEFPSIPFSENTKIMVGFNKLGLSYNRKPRIHVNDRGADYPVIVLNLDNPHNVKMSISCASDKCVIDDIFIGNQQFL